MTKSIKRWYYDTRKAITLKDTPGELLKLKITSKYIKFFRRDDVYSCYTYPPLHLLKKDKDFIEAIKDCMDEACMINEVNSIDAWANNDCDYPPFPITVIFNSDYQNYKYNDYE